MPTKPTILPKWASDDVADPSSGENNVAEPTETKKLKGWDFEEKPTRQWWNWLHRLTYQCIDWLFGTTIPLSSDAGTANEQLTDGTGHTHAINRASQAEAEAGADNDKVMTALRVKQAIDVRDIGGLSNVYDNATGLQVVPSSVLDGAGTYVVEAAASPSTGRSSRWSGSIYYNPDVFLNYAALIAISDGANSSSKYIQIDNGTNNVRVRSTQNDAFATDWYINRIDKIKAG